MDNAVVPNKMLKIQLYASVTGCPEKQRLIVQALGLKKLNRIAQRPDTPEFRGMVAKIPHLLRVVE